MQRNSWIKIMLGSLLLLISLIVLGRSLIQAQQKTPYPLEQRQENASTRTIPTKQTGPVDQSPGIMRHQPVNYPEAVNSSCHHKH